MATELSLVSLKSSSGGGAMTSSITPPGDAAYRVGTLGCAGEAPAGLLWRSRSSGQGGPYVNTLPRQSSR